MAARTKPTRRGGRQPAPNARRPRPGRSDPRADPHVVRRTLTRLVRNTFPGFDVRFVGDQQQAAPRSRRFGFVLHDAEGAPVTATIWLDPAFYRACTRTWLKRAARAAALRAG